MLTRLGLVPAVAPLLACLLVLAAPEARADLLRHCAAPPMLDAAQQDRLFRFAALVRDELQASGATLALVARAGLDLQRFGQRYSHAGISLQASPNTPWSVRQLYFDCEAGRPRLFDQGLPGFVLGGASPDQGHVVLWLLPPAAAQPLERSALDNRQALRLLGGRYSANAYAFGTAYQNCNQWVAELLALAWGGLGDAAGLPADDTTATRRQAQAWLQQQGYVPTRITVHNPLVTLAGALIPWLHTADHPADAVRRQQFDLSLPASIEAFLRHQVPGARRVELCHDHRQMVVRQGWQPLGDGCKPAPGDRVITLPAEPAAGTGA